MFKKQGKPHCQNSSACFIMFKKEDIPQLPEQQCMFCVMFHHYRLKILSLIEVWCIVSISIKTNVCKQTKSFII
jgi:hypothetical protein